MKKQTAVEWLVEQMFGEHTKAWQKQIAQAKAMEKEQMFDYTKSTHIIGEATERYFTEDFEQYYNKTYNTDTP